MIWRKNKIFCISFQRTGTRSTGEVLRRLGYVVAGWGVSNENQWSDLFYRGDYEAIFRSKSFKSSDAFEDAPWFCPLFYRYLYHRFPKSCFILLERDSESWIKSMFKHSRGKTLGNTELHCILYNRQLELWNRESWGEEISKRNGLELSGFEEGYKSVYEAHNRGVARFFEENEASRLFHAKLEDPEKWKKLARYLGKDFHDIPDIHENKSA